MAGSATMLLAFATPVSGLPWSSKGASSTLNPILTSGPESCSTASWVPFLMSVPTADMPPERGLWVAILMTLGAGAPHPASTTAARASIERKRMMDFRIGSSSFEAGLNLAFSRQEPRDSGTAPAARWLVSMVPAPLLPEFRQSPALVSLSCAAPALDEPAEDAGVYAPEAKRSRIAFYS